MKNPVITVLNTVIILVLCTYLFGLYRGFQDKKCPQQESKIDTVYITPESVPDELNLENVSLYLKALDVKFDSIVIRQAILETGWLESNACKNKHNLFGFTYRKKLMKFKHWKESIRYYANWQFRKYTGGDYYQFLQDIGYAEDPDYISKLKSIKI
jgi:flagellum-specific peptidoglycan hydrolase FlgJ